MSEAGQPNAAVLELAFWEAIARCVKDEQSPITVSLCGKYEKAGINFGNRIPSEVWENMAAALADLRAAAGVGEPSVVEGTLNLEALQRNAHMGDEVKAVQAVVIAAINALGVTLMGSAFIPVTSSPISDDEVAQILSGQERV